MPALLAVGKGKLIFEQYKYAVVRVKIFYGQHFGCWRGRRVVAGLYRFGLLIYKLLPTKAKKAKDKKVKLRCQIKFNN
jgi:hypothetical protein